MDKPIYIVGGGQSLEKFDFQKLDHYTTMAVNKSILMVPHAEYFVTMDYSFLGKIRCDYQQWSKHPSSKIFILNLDVPYITEEGGNIIDTRKQLKYNLSNFDVIFKSRRTKGIGFHFNDFCNGLNSGFCAMQLAILLGYNPINLLGFDLNAEKKTHFHEGYGERPEVLNNKLNDYYECFKVAFMRLKKQRPDIKIYSGSKDSRLNEFIEYREI